MKSVLIFGNNKISQLLHDALAVQGYSTVDITDGAPYTPSPEEEIYSVIDVSNADTNSETDSEFIHNTAGIKDLIDIAGKNTASFIFLYREAGELRPESPLATGLDLISSYARQKDISFAKVQVEDVYGPDVNTSRILAGFIESILEGDSLVVNKDDNEHYLLHQRDFVNGLTETIEILHKSKVGRHYTLFPEDAITEIELAHFVNDLTDLNLDIDYSSDEEYQHHELKENETNYPGDWYPETDLQQGIVELFEYYDIPIPENAELELQKERQAIDSEPLYDPMDKFDKPEDDFSGEIETHETPLFKDYEDFEEVDSKPNKISDSDDPYIPKLKPQAPKSKKSTKKKRTVVAAMAVVLLALISAPSINFTYKFVTAARAISEANEQIRSNNYPRANIESTKALEKLNDLNDIPKPINFLGSLSGVNTSEQYIYLDTYKELAEAITLTTSNAYITGIDNRVLGNSTDGQFNLQNQIDKSLELIATVENNLQSIDSKLRFIKGTINDGYELVRNTQDTLEQAKTINPVLGDLIGQNSPKKYLVLILDQNKIRPTGGTVKEIGLVEMAYGRPKILKTESISELNDQALLNIFPGQPEPIKFLTNNEGYKFEDSTWDADFPSNAKRIQNYYKIIRGEETDGVIAINGSALSKISDIEEALTISTLDQFLSKLEGVPTLGLKTFDLLNKKDIVIFSNSERLQTALLKNKWAGALSNETFDDYLSVVDSRIDQEDGVINITRETTYTGNHPQMNGDRYVRNLEIKYTSDESSETNTVYHVRVIVPKGSLLNSAKINNGGDDKNISRIVGLETYESYLILSTDIAIKPGNSTTLKLEYESPEKTYEDNDIELMVQKQPGINDEKLTLIFNNSDTSTNTETTLSKDTTYKFPL